MRKRVLKFGGTSVADPAAVRRVVDVICATRAEAHPVVVVSAMGGVTSLLLGAAEAAASGHDPSDNLEEIRARHLYAVTDLADGPDRVRLIELLEDELTELTRILDGMALVREAPARPLDRVLSYGERLSSEIVAAALRARGVRASAVDARRAVVTDDRFGEAMVDPEATAAGIRTAIAECSGVPVFTGFLGATPTGETTTLGRGGSDYSAALVGAALDAEAVEIWTDVCGVMSADPSLVPQAFSLETLSYDELLEMSHWGAKVIHGPAVRPVRAAGIPLIIRNTFDIGFAGTRVAPGVRPDVSRPVRGIASIGEVHLLTLEGDGHEGSRAIASRFFEALARVRAHVFLISQASSVRSICVAVDPERAGAAQVEIDAEFRLERESGALEPVRVEMDCSVIAAVGGGMRETPGIAGQVFSVLGRQGVNVRAIAQGASELNISLVVGSADEGRALRAIHDSFFVPGVRVAEVYLVGTGRVGGALLEQIRADEEARAAEGEPRRIRVSGLARSRGAHVAPDGVDLERWDERIQGGGEGIREMVNAAQASRHHPRVFVDCTASDAPVRYYGELLRSGVSIVCANKLGLSGPTAEYDRLRSAVSAGARLFNETTVGAALPLLRALADLRDTGDRVHSIEGVLSGTTSFLFDRIMSGVPLSEAVREAHDSGYTEPDPREDLSGRDVVRKAIILARTIGIAIEPDAVVFEPILGGSGWEDLDLGAFWDRLPEVDPAWEDRCTRALSGSRRLTYLARISRDEVRVEVTEISEDHPAWGLRGTDNLVAIRSDRYDRTPLVVRGPGAGPEVTAAGVYADVLRARAEAWEEPWFARLRPDQSSR